jgi:hypothetical protein
MTNTLAYFGRASIQRIKVLQDCGANVIKYFTILNYEWTYLTSVFHPDKHCRLHLMFAVKDRMYYLVG